MNKTSVRQEGGKEERRKKVDKEDEVEMGIIKKSLK